MTQETKDLAVKSGLLPAIEVKKQILNMFDKNRPGFEEGVNASDITIPRAALLQGLSPDVQKDPKNFYAGLLINSITKEQLPPTFVPIIKWTNWVRFNPRNNQDPAFDKNFKPGEIIWRSTDPDDFKVQAESKFGPNGEAPLATTFMNFLCYFEGFSMPLVLSFAKTGYKAGKNFFTMAMSFGGAMYSRKYSLRTVQQTNDKGSFYVPEVTPVGPCSEDELEIGKTLYDTFAPGIKSLKVHEENADDAESGA